MSYTCHKLPAWKCTKIKQTIIANYTIYIILYDTHVHRYFVYMHSNLYKSLAMEPPLGQNHVCYCSSVRAASRLSHRYSASLVVNVMGGLYFRTYCWPFHQLSELSWTSSSDCRWEICSHDALHCEVYSISTVNLFTNVTRQSMWIEDTTIRVASAIIATHMRACGHSLSAVWCGTWVLLVPSSG